MRKKWLYFPIETKAREFESRVLMSLFALQKGFNVVLAQHHVLRCNLEYFPKGIYFFKDLSFHKHELFEMLSSLQFRVVTLDEEALVSVNNPTRYAKERFSEDNLELVDKVICWSEFDYQAMFPTYEKFKDKFSKIGNPRLDMWSPALYDFFNDEVGNLKDKYGDFIFIPSNFAYRLHANGAKFETHYLEQNNIIKCPKDREVLKEFHEFMNRGYDYFLDLVARLSRDYPKLNIIVRNHPSEDPVFWNRVARRYCNVHVEYKGSITPYIKGSKCIVHFGCTSGLEAYLLGTPSLIFCPERNIDFDEGVSAKLSITHRTYASLRDELENILNGREIARKQAQSYFEKNFYNSNKLAADAIIDLFENDITAPSLEDNISYDFLRRRIRFKLFKSKIKNSVVFMPVLQLINSTRKSLGMSDHTATSKIGRKQKWPGLSRSEIVSHIERMSKILNIKVNIDCETICDEIFILRNTLR